MDRRRYESASPRRADSSRCLAVDVTQDPAFLHIWRLPLLAFEDRAYRAARPTEYRCAAAPRMLTPVNAVQHLSWTQAKQLCRRDAEQFRYLAIHQDRLALFVQNHGGSRKGVQHRLQHRLGCQPSMHRALTVNRFAFSWREESFQPFPHRDRHKIVDTTASDQRPSQTLRLNRQLLLDTLWK